MNAKAKIGLSALWLIGIIYTLLGSVFVGMGILFAVASSDGELRLMGTIFAGVGSIFLILGIVFIVIQLLRKRRNDRLIAAGRFVWGEIIELAPNLAVRINHRHPYIATIRYTDPYGVCHMFKSGSLNILNDPGLLGRHVKVYISDDSCKHYYVDMDSALPQYRMH